MPRSRSGFTLLEILLSLAIAATVIVVLLAAFRSEAGAFTRALRAFALSARLEAVARNLPAAVVYLPDRRAFELRLGSSDTAFADPCDGPALRSLRLSDYRNVTLFRWLRHDLVWLPTGVGRSCSGSGVYNGTVVLGGRSPSHRLVVSSAGRVRSEMLP